MLAAGISFFDIGQEVYRHMSVHHVEEHPMSMPFIFLGIFYYAFLTGAILLLTGLVYLLRAKR